MTPDSRHELEPVVEKIRALIVQLRQCDQPLVMQLLEMAMLDLKSQIHGIGDGEFDALVNSLSGRSTGTHDPAKAVDSTLIGERHEGIGRPAGPARVVIALGEARLGNRKRRN